MTSTTITQRDSVVRLVWRATMPESVAFIGPILGLLIVQAWFLWQRPERSLWQIASSLRLLVFMLGAWTVSVGLMLDRESRPEWTKRLIRGWRKWTHRGASAVGGQDTGLEDPGAAVVAQPVVSTMGMTFVGFAIGLNLIVWFTPASIATESHRQTFIFGLAMVLVVIIFMLTVSSVTRRLYEWTVRVAASAATAEAEADAARIAVLQSQMNPHFLFNALNTVASLIGTDSTRGQRTIKNLKGMLQHTLERSSQPLTTVADEIQFVRDYLDIESERFGSRLQVTYAIEADTMELSIPTMSLQPIVENAVKHAISNRLEGGHIRITVARRPGLPSLRLSVDDDGPGFGPRTAEGTGLRNLRARLQTLYGSAAMLATDNLSQGARVSLTIPFDDGRFAYARIDR